jgi:hypothetical protein
MCNMNTKRGYGAYFAKWHSLNITKRNKGRERDTLTLQQLGIKYIKKATELRPFLQSSSSDGLVLNKELGLSSLIDLLRFGRYRCSDLLHTSDSHAPSGIRTCDPSVRAYRDQVPLLQ